MNLKTSLLDRISFYRTIQDRAGVSLRCLDPDADETLTAAVEAGDNGAVTVRVQGPLDDWFGFDVRALIAELDEASPDSIHLLIESPGGFLDDGLALYSDLRARARDGATVTAEARGVVASAAVLPFLAADRRAMSTGTQMLIHEPWLFFAAIGTADEIEDGAEKAINGLRAGEKTLHQVMVERTGNSRQGSWPIFSSPGRLRSLALPKSRSGKNRLPLWQLNPPGNLGSAQVTVSGMPG